MTTIVLYNLHPRVSRRDLTILFEDIGEFTSVKLFNDTRNRTRELQRGYIKFRSYKDALQAINAYNGKELDGRELQIVIKPNLQL